MTPRDDILTSEANVMAENARSAAHLHELLGLAIDAIEAGKIIGGVRLMRTVERHLRADATTKAVLADMMRRPRV